MSRQLTITSPSGATLKTKNKYVDDDIKINVSGASDIIASNIKSGATILGISGTLPDAPNGTMGIVENGTYNVSTYENVTVNVPSFGGDAEYILKRIPYGYRAILIANYIRIANEYGTTIHLIGDDD